MTTTFDAGAQDAGELDEIQTIVTDPGRLPGFTATAVGARASDLGEAGEWIILLDHHDEPTALAAARELLLAAVTEEEADQRMRYAGAPQARYARFGYTSDADRDAGEWCCDFDHDGPGPDRLPVTMLYLG